MNTTSMHLGIRSYWGIRVMYLKKIQNIKQQVLRYKAKVQNPKYIETEYKLIKINHNHTSFKI